MTVALPQALVGKRRERAQQRLREALEAEGERVISTERSAEVYALVQRWAERGFDEGFSDAESFELRCFADAELAKARAEGDREGLFAAMVARHRAAVLRELGKIEIRGLQMSERVYQDLDVAYVPLWIRDDSREPETLKIGDGVEIQAIPRVSAPELLQRHERAVLVGAPGSGKTTIVAYLAAQAANGRLHGMTGWAESPVPFVVPVRSLAESRLDAKTIAQVGSGLDVAFVRDVLKAGKGLVLLDGLDEAREGAASMIAALKGFAEKHPGNRILVTTRPASAVDGERMEIEGFATTTLEAMTREEVYVFIEKWCLAAERSLQKDPAKAAEDARRAAEDLKSRVQASRPVERLAQTPLICSILCIVHRFLGQRIPERRAALYEVCTNVLLYEWDRAKFPEGATIGQLDAQQKKFLLGGLAHAMHEERVAEISRGEVIRIFAERLPSMERASADAEKIIREIQDRSGILVERRPGFYAFSHLTFQEYLTAVEVVRLGELDHLVDHHKDRWWHEVTVLAAGLPMADAASLIRGLLEIDARRIHASKATMLAAQCVETAVQLPTSLRAEVQRRIEPLLPPRDHDAVERLIALGGIAAPLLLRAIDAAPPASRARICAALSMMRYEPACGALQKMLDDTRVVAERIYVCFGTRLFRWGAGATVSQIAAVALFNISISSPSTRAIFETTIASRPASTFSMLLELQNINNCGPFPTLEVEIGTVHKAYLKQVLPVIKGRLEEKTSHKPAARSD